MVFGQNVGRGLAPAPALGSRVKRHTGLVGNFHQQLEFCRHELLGRLAYEGEARREETRREDVSGWREGRNAGRVEKERKLEQDESGEPTHFDPS